MNLELEKKLISCAQQGVKNALTRSQSESDACFGASVLTESGEIYASGQYHYDTASLTLHAEQAALAHAAAHGDYEIIALAVASNTGEVEYPCHMCKQLLWENHLRSGKDIEILITHKGEVVERFSLTKIMSHTWPK